MFLFHYQQFCRTYVCVSFRKHRCGILISTLVLDTSRCGVRLGRCQTRIRNNFFFQCGPIHRDVAQYPKISQLSLYLSFLVFHYCQIYYAWQNICSTIFLCFFFPVESKKRRLIIFEFVVIKYFSQSFLEIYMKFGQSQSLASLKFLVFFFFDLLFSWHGPILT